MTYAQPLLDLEKCSDGTTHMQKGSAGSLLILKNLKTMLCLPASFRSIESAREYYTVHGPIVICMAIVSLPPYGIMVWSVAIDIVF